MSEKTSLDITPQEELESLLEAQNHEALAIFLHLLAPEDTPYIISHLSESNQLGLFSMLSLEDSELAADLLDHLPDAHAADILEDLDPDLAASIVDCMDSDQQADVLLEVEDNQAETILSLMTPEEAQDTRMRLQYDSDIAGGLMITEILQFFSTQKIGEIVRNLQGNEKEYDPYETRYIYLTDKNGKLEGVVSTRVIALSPRNNSAEQIMKTDLTTVDVNSTLSELERLFDRVDFSSVPVIDDQGVLLGAVRRSGMHEALAQRSEKNFLKFGGIIGGEELRSMGFKSRWARRLAFLIPGIFLSLLSVSIIDYYQPLIHKLTVLAVFLPLVANLSGAAGNQAVAVSIRELALGLVKPKDVGRVLSKEIFLGLANGVIIGAVLMLVFVLTQDNHYMIAVVIGAAYSVNSMFSVSIGGTLPLMMQAMKMDPAMMSGPILTTLTDMGSFFLTLTFTVLMLMFIGGGG